MTTFQDQPKKIYDMLIVGGGINGCGIAADAAGRGLSVLLCEQNDLASATSSASSKLIHGGLRYLEYYEFRLVREALAEREVLLKKAPHIVTPMRFILPHRPHLRPSWMIRAGLFLYDHLGKRKALPGSKSVKFDQTSPLKDSMKKGFVYSDCWVDDARLVVLNAISTQLNNGTILTRTRCINATRNESSWDVTLENIQTKVKQTVQTKVLVNAAGPWVESFIKNDLELSSPYSIRLIKGSHIIVPKLYDHKDAYILQNEDKRVVFVIPYLEQFSLIGTTDLEYHGSLDDISITPEETHYLLDIVNQHFKKQLQTNDVISSYSGVRPLCDDESSDPSAITRDYTLTLEAPEKQAPLLSIFGGKITTYRKLAEAAIEKVKPFFPNIGPQWTLSTALPGGEAKNLTEIQQQILEKFPWLNQDLVERYSQTYGLLCFKFLADCSQMSDLGENFGANLYSKEVDYLLEQEWAMTCEDILWRRTKLGLLLNEAQVERLESHLNQQNIKQSA